MIIDDLVLVLRRQISAAAMMETLLMKKQRALVGWHSDDLALVVAEIEGVLSTLSVLEKERTALMKAMSANDPQCTSMQQLLVRFPSEELRQAHRELREVSARVIRRNGQNNDLVYSSLSFVRRTLGFITGNFRQQLLDQKV